MDGPLKIAILIVSTTAAEDPSTDSSAQALQGVIEGQGPGKWSVDNTAIVTDDVSAIQRQLMALADGPEAANLIITTGGTGFSVADVTPEVNDFPFPSLASYLM
jgi:gephyrin